MHLPVLADVAALVYLAMTVVAVGFQVALALGAPWGQYAMGGRFPGRFPPTMRLLAAVQAVILSLLALIVVSRAGLIVPEATADRTAVAWFPVVVSGASLWMNLNTPSAKERRVWVPATAILTVSSLVVALTA
jgi:hypothetical protein